MARRARCTASRGASIYEIHKIFEHLPSLSEGNIYTVCPQIWSILKFLPQLCVDVIYGSPPQYIFERGQSLLVSRLFWLLVVLSAIVVGIFWSVEVSVTYFRTLLRCIQCHDTGYIEDQFSPFSYPRPTKIGKTARF